MISVSQNQRLNLQYANNIFKFSAYAYQYTSSFSEQKYYNCLRRCSAFSNPNLERGWEDPCPSQEHEVITEDLLQCQYLPPSVHFFNKKFSLFIFRYINSNYLIYYNRYTHPHYLRFLAFEMIGFIL